MRDFYLIWELLINIIESSFLVIFMEDKFKNNDKFPKRLNVFLNTIFILVNSICITVCNYLNLRYEATVILFFIITFVYTLVFYDYKISGKLFFASLFIGIVFASDCISSFLPQLFFNTLVSDILVGGPFRIPATLMYLTCIATLVFISHFVRWKTFSLSPFEMMSYITLCIIGFLFGQYISSLTIEAHIILHNDFFSNRLILVSLIYCFLFLILLTYIYILNYTKEQNRKLREDKQQLLLEEADYKNLIETTDSLRELKHDMQHHLSTIQYLAQENNIFELNDYIDKYIGILENMHQFVSTGNSAIDCILSTSIPKAKQLGIDVSSILTVPDTFNLDPILTSSLLGNLWTNAITASENLLKEDSSKKVFINFYIKPIENMLLISIENTYNGVCKKNADGQYLSTKTSKRRGIGLRRISEIVEQNDGFLEITDNNNLFCVHIMFPLKEKNFYENSNS